MQIKSLMSIILILISCDILFSQEKYKIIREEEISNVFYFDILSAGVYAGSSSGINYNLLLGRYNYFDLGIYSMFKASNNTLDYFVPFGLHYPLKFGNLGFINVSYAIGLNSNFYLFTTSPITEFDENPKLAELSINFDTMLFSLSTGYRFQFGKWTKQDYDDRNDILFASEVGRLDGFYVKASIGLIAIFGDKKYKEKKIYLPEPSLSLDINLPNTGRFKIGNKYDLEIFIENHGDGLAENINLEMVISDIHETLFRNNKRIGDLKQRSYVKIIFPFNIKKDIERQKQFNLRIRCIEKDGFSANITKIVSIIPDRKLEDGKLVKEDVKIVKDDFIYIIVNSANVRSGPSTDYDILFKVSYSDKLKILEKNNKWLKIADIESSKEGWIFTELTSPVKPTSKPKKQKIVKSELPKEGYGRFMKYRYSFGFTNNSYIITYTPFLPRDDAIVIGAMLDAINNIYGKHKIIDFKPRFVNRNGIKYISFTGIDFNYLFLLIKQDTGEVHSFSLFREKK